MYKVAHNFVEAFNALLDAYRQIAESLPIINQQGANYHNDSTVQQILELTFIDIFEFHRMALKVFRSSGGQTLWTTCADLADMTLSSLETTLPRDLEVL